MAVAVTTVCKKSSWKESWRLLRAVAVVEVCKGSVFNTVAGTSTVVSICRWWQRVLAIQRALAAVEVKGICCMQSKVYSAWERKDYRRCWGRIFAAAVIDEFPGLSSRLMQEVMHNMLYRIVTTCAHIFVRKQVFVAAFVCCVCLFCVLPVPSLEWNSSQVRLCGGCGGLLHPIPWLTGWLRWAQIIETLYGSQKVTRICFVL